MLQSVFSSFSWTCHILRSPCQFCSMLASLGLSVFSLLVLIWLCGESDALLFRIPHVPGDASQDIVRSLGHVVLVLTVRFLHWAVSVFLFPYWYKCSLYSGLNSMSCGKNIKDLQIHEKCSIINKHYEDCQNLSFLSFLSSARPSSHWSHGLILIYCSLCGTVEGIKCRWNNCWVERRPLWVTHAR